MERKNLMKSPVIEETDITVDGFRLIRMVAEELDMFITRAGMFRLVKGEFQTPSFILPLLFLKERNRA